MVVSDGALEHVVLLLRQQGRGYAQQLAQLEDEGLRAGQLAGAGKLHALPAADKAGYLGRVG